MFIFDDDDDAHIGKARQWLSAALRPACVEPMEPAVGVSDVVLDRVDVIADVDGGGSGSAGRGR